MPDHVKSGYRGRPDRSSILAVEFRAQALADQVKDLTRDLVRLRAAARDVLEALPSDQGAALVRLRHELARHPSHREAAA